MTEVLWKRIPMFINSETNVHPGQFNEAECNSDNSAFTVYAANKAKIISIIYGHTRVFGDGTHVQIYIYMYAYIFSNWIFEVRLTTRLLDSVFKFVLM